MTTKTEPMTAPVRLPRPPMTTAASNVSETDNPNAFGEALELMRAISAPPSPAHAALTTKASTWTRATDRPDSEAEISSSRTARIDRPTLLRIRLAVSHSSTIAQTPPTNSGHWMKLKPWGGVGVGTDSPWLPLRWSDSFSYCT